MNLLNTIKSISLTLLVHCSAALFSQSPQIGSPPCNCTINAGPDKNVCSPGGSVILNASYTGTPASFEWLPTPGLDDYTILNPEATVTETTNFTFTLRCRANNYSDITNHDFSSGNSGFTNDYSYVSMPGAPFSAGNYTVTNDPSLYNPAFTNCGDHTTGSGMMLLIDGSVTAGEDLWCQNVILVPNQEYAFDFWVALTYPISPPEIQITCNDIIVGQVSVENDPTCQWTKYTVYFNPGANSVVNMCMQNLNGDGFGNDFVIDDIALEEICVLEDFTTVYVQPIKNSSIAAIICEGQTYNYNNQSYSVPGDYDIVFKTWKNCDSIVTLNLEVMNVNAEIDIPQLISCKNSTITLNGDNSSFGMGYSYLWTTLNGKIDTDPKLTKVVVSKPGTYTLTVTYFLNGLKCEKSATTQVFGDFILPIMSAGKDTIFSCGDTVLNLKGIVQAPATGYSLKWSTINGKIESKSDTLEPQVSSGGVYVFSVSNNLNGCIQTDTVLVGQDSSLPKSIINGPGFLTCSIDSIWLDGSKSDHGKPYTFNWSTVDGSFISKTDSLQVLINKSGEYLLTIQDTVSGCKSTSSIKIISDQQTPNVDGGAMDTLTCNITQMKLKGFTSLPDSLAEIKWNTINGIIVSGANTLTPTIKKAGTYFIMVLNKKNGCSNTDSVTIINDVDLPNAYIGADDTINCIQSIIDIQSLGTNTSPFLDYQWSTINGNIIGPDTNLTIQGDKPGLYLLRITNTLSACSSYDTMEVLLDKQLPIVSILKPSKLTCILNEVDLDATNSSIGSNFNYLWSTPNGNISGPVNQILSNAKLPGTYYFTITNEQNGCINTDSVNIFQDVILPDISIQDAGQITCKNPVILLTTVVNSIPLPLVLQWTTINGIIEGSSTSYTALISGPGTYNLITTNLNNGCTDSDSIIIGSNFDTPIAFAPNDTFLSCCHIHVDVTGKYQHINNNISYEYSSISGFVLSQIGGNAELATPGTFIFSVIDNNSGCIGSDTFIVENKRKSPIVNILNPLVINCTDTTRTLKLNNVGSNWTINWNTTNGNILSNTTYDSIDINKGGEYIVNIKDLKYCCETYDTVKVIEDKIHPLIDAGADQVIGCADSISILEGVIISSSGNVIINWLGNNGQTITQSNSLNPTVTEQGVYYFTVTQQENVCQSIDSVKVSPINDGPTELNSSIINVECGVLGSIYIISVNGGTAPYLYSINGNSFQSANSFNDLNVGSYTIDIQDINGCLFSKDLEITESPVGSLKLPADLTVQFGDSVQLLPVINGLDIQDIDSILWSPNNALSCIQCLSPFATPTSNELYTLVIYDKSGCKLSASVNILVNNITNIFIPNVFSPNGDGINDNWKIFTDSKIVKRINHIAVFDRWGEGLWEAIDITDLSNYSGWDGKSRGQKLNTGVVVYYAEIEFIDGTKRLYKGDITLTK